MMLKKQITLEFMSDDWDGIESGIVTWFCPELNKVIKASYNLNEFEMNNLCKLWQKALDLDGDKMPYADSKATIGNVAYENMWEYIIKNYPCKYEL